MDIFAWLSNIYRLKIYLWHVSYALRKTKLLKRIKQYKYIPCLPWWIYSLFAVVDIFTVCRGEHIRCLPWWIYSLFAVVNIFAVCRGEHIRCLPWWIYSLFAVVNIFAVCRGESIWSMINIKGCLRISVHKLERLCEFTLSFITALAQIDLLGYFKSGFGLKYPLFLRSPYSVDDSSYSRCSGDERRRLRHSFERRNQSTYQILVTDYWITFETIKVWRIH